MKIQHVFFDLDHTLWDFEKNSDLTFQKVFKINNLQIDINSFLEIYKPLNFSYWKLYREEKVTKSALRYGRLKETFDAMWKEAGINGLNGHRSVGGYRASMYNALTLDSVKALVEVMSELERKA